MLKHSRHNSQDSRYSSARHGFEAGDQMSSSTHAHGEAPLRTRGKGFAHAIENVTRTNSFALVVFIILVVGLVGVGIHAALFPKEAGYTPMIYGSMKDLLRYNLPDLAHYNIWLAQYNVNAPTFNQYFSIWQYSNTGSVSGIDGNVDMNIQFLAEEK